MKRKIVTLILAIVLVCTVSATMLVGCKPKEKEQPTPAKASTYVALDINPSVELILDENNKVMSVRGLNEDAKVLLYGEDGIIGADVNVAVKKIGKLSADLKYINKDNNTVNITVGGSTAAGNELSADISASLNEGAGVSLNVKVGANFSLQREIDALKAQYKDNQDIQNIDVAKYRVMMEAMAADAKLTVEEAVKMEMDDLLDIVEDARDIAIDMLPKAQKAALEVSEAAYDAIKERLESGVYYKIAREDAKLNIVPNVDDHIKYIIYKNLDITLDRIEALIESAHADLKEEVKKADVDAIFAELVAKEVITEEQATNAKKDIVDAEGNADLDKMEEKLDIILKNAKEDAVKTVEEFLDTKLDEAEDAYEELAKDIPTEIREDLKKLFDDVKAEVNDELKEVGIDLGKAETIVNNTIDLVINKIDPMTIGYDALEGLSDYVEAKLEGGEYESIALNNKNEKVKVKVPEADSLEAKVIGSLSEDQLNRAEQLMDDIKKDNTKLAEAKKAYDAAVTKACNDARVYLEKEKAARKAA